MRCPICPLAAAKEGPVQEFLEGPWTGLQNFRSLFSDLDFKIALVNTIQIEILQLVFAFPAPLAVALLV